MTKWTTKTLGEVCEIKVGATPLKSNNQFWDNGTIPWFTIKDIRKQGRVIKTTEQYISQLALDSNSLILLPAHTVLLCCTASVGEYAVTEIELTTNQQFNGLIVKDPKKLYYLYLFYYSATLKSTLLSVSGKTTIDFVSLQKIKNLPIPVPPLAEQKKIVALLDEAFATLDHALESCERALELARELWLSALDRALTFDNAEVKSLGEVCEIAPPKKQVYNVLKDSDNVSFLPMEDLGIYQQYTQPKYEKPLKALYKAYTYFQENDILLAKITPCFENGKMAIAKNLVNNVGFGSSEYIVIRPSQSITSEYVNYFLSQPLIRISGKRLMTGSVGHKRIPKEYISNLLIPLPTLSEQKEIVAKLDKIQASIQKLESDYQQKIQNIKELKASLLNEAFSGTLIKE